MLESHVSGDGSVSRGRRLLTFANVLSALRVPLAALFVLTDGMTRLGVVVVAAVSDWADGRIARRTDSTTTIGALIDPAADKIFTVVAVVTLVAQQRVPAWTLPLLLTRDIGVAIGAALLVARGRIAQLKARRAGKIVTWLQFAAIAAMLLAPSSARWLAPAVAAAGVLALIDYARAARRAETEDAARPIPRRATRALLGMLIAPGAPLGWLLIRSAGGASIAAELGTRPGLYFYMLVGTLLVFGMFGFILGMHEDHLVQANRRLSDLAVTDSLTGLRNARYFHARLVEEHARHLRTGAPFSLVILDLDHFKRVNDEHGHMVGDDVLANAARAIASVTRHGETEARVGGEEFALLLPGSDAAAAFDAAERVRAAIAATGTQLPDGEVLYVSASAGVASAHDLPRSSPNLLYRAADEALYAAKAAGRDRTLTAASGIPS